MDEAGGWVFAVILGPVILGAVIAFAITRNRRRRAAPDIRSPSYNEDGTGSVSSAKDRL